MNSIHHAPSTWTKDVTLWHAVTYNIPNGDIQLFRDEDYAPTVAKPEARGCLWIEGLYKNSGVWRVSPVCRDRVCNFEHVLCRVWGAKDFADICAMFGLAKGKTGSHANWTANRGQPTQSATLYHPAPTNADVRALQLDHVATRQPIVLYGPDITHNPQLVAAQTRQDQDMDVGRTVARILFQFPSDMMQQCPNYKSRAQGSHTLLNAEQRQTATWETFETKDLNGIFTAIWYKRCTEYKWQQVFDLYFPLPHLVRNDRQNFNSCGYWQSYCALITTVDVLGIPDVQRTLRDRFNQIKWIAHPYYDHMWRTSYPGVS